MSTLQRFALVCILGAASAALLPACGSDTDGGSPGGAGAATAGAAGAAGAAGGSVAGAAGAPPAGDATRGLAVYNNETAACNLCHGTTGQGLAGPNITGSTTAGIGTWTYADFSKQIRTGVRKDGSKNCSNSGMPEYTVTEVSDAQIADLYAYLMSVKTETPNAGSTCP